MGSILAIVSKAMFDREAKRLRSRLRLESDAVALGQTLDIDRYISRGPALAPLRDGGSLVLVTVRPPHEKVWLVAILDNPKLGDDGYVAPKANTAPLTEVTSMVRELLEQATRSTPKPGRLAMSLQTPRLLAPEWLARFRDAAFPSKAVVVQVPPPPSNEKEDERERDEPQRVEDLFAPIPSSLPVPSPSATADDEDEEPAMSRAPSSMALPSLLRSPPWKSKRLPPVAERDGARTFRLNLATRGCRLEWPRHSRDLALGVARLRKCANWRDATKRDIDVAMARLGPEQSPTGPNRVCLGVLSTLPEADALDIARRVPLRSFCHQSTLLLPALARLGAGVAPLIVHAAMNKERRAPAFAALEHLGTPLAVPVMLDAIVRLATLRPMALRWLMHYADVTLDALVPLAVGVSPSALGLDGYCPQTPDPLRRAAHRALLRIAAAHKTTSAIMTVARDLDLEDETAACLRIHVLGGRKPPVVPRFRAVPLPRPHTPLISATATLAPRISKESFTVMLELLALTDWEARSDDIETLESSFERSSLVTCLETILTKWIGARAARTQRWILDAACQMVDGVLQGRVVDFIRSWRGVYELSSGKAIEVLARAAIAQAGRPAGDRALESLGALAHRGGSGERVAAAKHALQQVADALALPKDTIGDRLVPRLGLDDRGRMELEVAGKKLVARLDSSLTPYLTILSTNERITELPRVERRGMRAMKTSDERETERWARLRKESRPVAEDVAKRAEGWMRLRKRWTVDDFRAHVVGHPVLREVAAGLVWGVYEMDRGLQTTFRVCEDQTFAGSDDGSFSLPSIDCEVGVVHPVELDDKAIAAWADIVFDYRIVPIFDQLAWPVMRLTDQERASSEVLRFTNMIVGYSVPADLWTWREFPAAIPWLPGGGGLALAKRQQHQPPQSPIVISTYQKRLDRVMTGAPLRAVLTLETGGSHGLYKRVVRNIRVQPFAELSHDAGWLPWSEVDAVSASEMLLELSKRVEP